MGGHEFEEYDPTTLETQNTTNNPKGVAGNPVIAVDPKGSDDNDRPIKTCEGKFHHFYIYEWLAKMWENLYTWTNHPYPGGYSKTCEKDVW